MMLRYWRFVWVTCCLVISSPMAISENLDSLVSKAIVFSKHQLQTTVALLGDSAVFPRSTLADGSWKTAKPNDWTSGFFPGCLWLVFELTGDSSFVHHAARWTEKLETQKLNTNTHDVGFIMNCSFGNGYRGVNSDSYRQVLLEAARSLSTRYSPTVGSIRSWDNRKWPFPVIIDNMMNLELLFWAAKNGGPKELYDIAVTHALTTMRNHFRNDGSTYHVVSYDSTTGSVLAKETHQGYTHESVWARGQAWAIYGFTMAYRETRDERFLTTAERAANWFIAHLPEDCIPFWDFNAPRIPNEPRDASAAAIAASALFELSGLTKNRSLQAYYVGSAKRIMSVLCTAPFLGEGSDSMGILNHATGNKPASSEIDVSLIYADYYLLEAIQRYRKIQSE